jgi:molybdenum cofactor guanylyltransferase
MNGLVLAGGQSTRMHQNKALINYHGLPQYQYVYHLLQAHCSQIFISTNTLNADIELPQIIDPKHLQHIGPIAALHAAFDAQCTDWLVVAVDYPLLTRAEIKKIIATPNIGQDATVYFNQDTNFYEPFIGIYHSAFKAQLKIALQNNNTSMQVVLQNSNVVKVFATNTNALTNVNTPTEAKQILKKI